jgi:hypothetical protein
VVRQAGRRWQTTTVLAGKRQFHLHHLQGNRGDNQDPTGVQALSPRHFDLAANSVQIPEYSAVQAANFAVVTGLGPGD